MKKRRKKKNCPSPLPPQNTLHPQLSPACRLFDLQIFGGIQINTDTSGHCCSCSMFDISILKISSQTNSEQSDSSGPKKEVELEAGSGSSQRFSKVFISVTVCQRGRRHASGATSSCITAASDRNAMVFWRQMVPSASLHLLHFLPAPNYFSSGLQCFTELPSD